VSTAFRGPGYGNAAAQNAAVQGVDPQPAYADAGAPDLNGRRAALAIERYESGKTIRPIRLGTTSGGGR
jgi:hypothetical protein